METGLTQDEIHLLLKDMTDVCLRPPEDEAWRIKPTAGAELPNERTSPLGRLCRRLDAMRPWSLLALVAATLIPLTAVTVQVALLGPLPSLGILALSALAGSYVILRQGTMAFRSFAEFLSGLQTGRSVSLCSALRAVRVLGGLLLLLPDPLTSLAGLLLLVPDVQQAVARQVLQETSPVFALS